MVTYHSGLLLCPRQRHGIGEQRHRHVVSAHTLYKMLGNQKQQMSAEFLKETNWGENRFHISCSKPNGSKDCHCPTYPTALVWGRQDVKQACSAWGVHKRDIPRPCHHPRASNTTTTTTFEGQAGLVPPPAPPVNYDPPPTHPPNGRTQITPWQQPLSHCPNRPPDSQGPHALLRTGPCLLLTILCEIVCRTSSGVWQSSLIGRGCSGSTWGPAHTWQVVKTLRPIGI